MLTAPSRSVKLRREMMPTATTLALIESNLCSPSGFWGCDTSAQLAIKLAEKFKQAASGVRPGDALAAAFDVLVSVEYFVRGQADETGRPIASYHSCPHMGKDLAFGVPNCCLPCLSTGLLENLKGSKPQSAILGQTNSGCLARMIECLLRSKNSRTRVLCGREPADILILVEDQLAVLGEIKSGPLCPFGFLALDAATASVRVHSTGLSVKPGHSEFAMLAFAVESHHAVKIPIKAGKGVVGRQAVCSILEQLLAADGSVKLFLHWQQCRNEYHLAGSSTPTKHTRSRFYWATAGCGGPSQSEAPRWPRKQTVSDGKTSVGMDRTDDIKKAAYQMLALRSWHNQTCADSAIVFTGLFSNFPAVRHSEYIKIIESHFVMQPDSSSTPRRLVDVVYSFPDARTSDSRLKTLFTL